MSNRTKVDWADATLNPLGWGCYGPEGTAENPKPCSYCFAHAMSKRNLNKCELCNDFLPHLHLE